MTDRLTEFRKQYADMRLRLTAGDQEWVRWLNAEVERLWAENARLQAYIDGPRLFGGKPHTEPVTLDPKLPKRSPYE